MQKQKITIRVDDYVRLQLEELAGLTGYNISVVMRMLIVKGLERLTDEKGNICILPIKGPVS